MRFAASTFALAVATVLTHSLSTATTGVLYLMTDAAAKDDAVCLDGTPGGYYFAPGSGSGAHKWFVFHQGGGWCESFEDCYGRSQTALGSSKSYAKTAVLDGQGGYFSSNATTNPMFANWNKVFMNYCDGASFSGSNSSVSVVKGVGLHFRGKHVLDAMIVDLLANRGLKSATDLVVSGCSAGGLATYLHADKWAAAVSASVRVTAMPDSGFFLDYEGLPAPADEVRAKMFVEEHSVGLSDIGPGIYQADMQWVFSQQNTSSGVHQSCIAFYPPAQQWMCMFAEHTSPFIQTPMFPLQSEYDSWQIGNVLAVNNNAALIQELGNNITSRLQANLLRNPQHGVFLDSCEHHCGAWGAITIDGNVQATAFEAWYSNPSAKKYWIQGQQYPCAACCKNGN